MAKKSMVAKTKRNIKRAEIARALKDSGKAENEKGRVVKVRNRCSLCGRPRSYIRQFGLCRICFRKNANFGLIPGVKKLSW